MVKKEEACNHKQGIYFINAKSNSAKEVAIALSFADGPCLFLPELRFAGFLSGISRTKRERKATTFNN